MRAARSLPTRKRPDMSAGSASGAAASPPGEMARRQQAQARTSTSALTALSQQGAQFLGAFGTGGAIAPGIYYATTGTLTFTDNVNLANGGTFFVLAGPGGAANFIDVGGTLTLGGTSAFAFNGAAADPGTAYIVAHYGTLSGVFTSFFGLPAGATVDYNYHGLNEIAVITAVPEIAMASAGGAFALIACSLALLGRRGPKRRRHAG